MTILADVDILNRLHDFEDKPLIIRPFDVSLLQPASVDCHFGNEITTFHPPSNFEVDLHNIKELNKWAYRRPLTEEGEVIAPHSFALINSLEYIKVPDDLCVQVDGRSSIGRIGLTVHITAGFCDPGFKGNIVYECANLMSNPIRVYPGDCVGQLIVHSLSQRAQRPYGHPDLQSHYQGQTGAQMSLYEVHL